MYTAATDSDLIRWIMVLTVLYLFPAIIATAREHHQTAAIWVLNIFTGWTFVGWIASLVWAATQVRK